MILCYESKDIEIKGANLTTHTLKNMAEKPQTLDISASLSDDSKEHFFQISSKKWTKRRKNWYVSYGLFSTFTLEMFYSKFLKQF